MNLKTLLIFVFLIAGSFAQIESCMCTYQDFAKRVYQCWQCCFAFVGTCFVSSADASLNCQTPCVGMQSENEGNVGFRIHYINMKESSVVQGQFFPEKNSGLPDQERLFSLLNKNSEILAPNSRPERFVGHDQRKYLREDSKKYPYSAIAQIVAFKDDESLSGYATGFKIDHEFLLTAGHAVTNGTEIAKELFVLLGAEKDDLPYGVMRPSDVYMFRRSEEYTLAPEHDPALDIALIKLNIEIGSKIKGLNLQEFDEDSIKKFCQVSDLSEIRATIAGYDIIRKENEGKFNFCMMTHEDKLSEIKKGILKYKIHTNNGQSGSPVIIKTNGIDSVIAVHNASFLNDLKPNGGAPLTKEIITKIAGIVESHKKSKMNSKFPSSGHKLIDSDDYYIEDDEDQGSDENKSEDKDKNVFESERKLIRSINTEANKCFIQASTHFKEKNYEKTLQDYSKLIGLTHHAMESWLRLKAKTFLNMGLLCKAQKKFEEAIKNLHESLKIFLDLDKYSTRSISDIYSNLGDIHFESKKYKEAREYYQKAQEIFSKIDADLVTINYLKSKIGSTYLKESNYELALIYFQECLEIYKKNPDSTQLYAAETHNKLAKLYKKQKNYTKALEQCNEALKICNKIDNNHLSATTNYIMSKIYKKMQDYDKAFEFALFSKNINKKNHESTQDSIAKTYCLLFSICTKQKKLKKPSIMVQNV